MATKRRFSDDLRRAVKRSHKTRYRIAKETGIAQSILSRFINQGAGVSMDSIDKLCECLGLRLVAEDKPRKQKGR